MPTSAVVPPSQVSASATIIGPRVVIGTVPAAGAEVFEVVPAGFLWKLVSLEVLFTTSATVATRVPLFQFTDGLGNLFFERSSDLIIANASASYNFSDTTDLSGLLFSPHAAFPQMWLRPAYTFGTRTLNIQAGDQFAAPVFYIEEYASND